LNLGVYVGFILSSVIEDKGGGGGGGVLHKLKNDLLLMCQLKLVLPIGAAFHLSGVVFGQIMVLFFWAICSVSKHW
jgi:hypothetical protein